MAAEEVRKGAVKVAEAAYAMLLVNGTLSSVQVQRPAARGFAFRFSGRALGRGHLSALWHRHALYSPERGVARDISRLDAVIRRQGKQRI